MATFTMPATKRLPGLDPVVFPRREGVDYKARADEAWRSITENLAAIETETKRLLALCLRITDGEGWMRGKTEHPRYMEAYQLVNELRNKVLTIDVNLRCLRKVIWHECCTLYAALHHTDRDEWLAGHGVTFTAESPFDIWESVCPGKDAPGSWPPSEKDHYIERKLTYTGWNELAR